MDAALSQTTRCRIDVSTPNGRDNSFAQRFFSGKVPTFLFTWRDCPTNTEEWYAQQVATLPPHVLGQEINVDFNASVEGILIPRIWAEAAIGAHNKLAFQSPAASMPASTWRSAGIAARCAYGAASSSVMESWSGAGSDLYASTVRAMNILDQHGWDSFALMPMAWGFRVWRF